MTDVPTIRLFGLELSTLDTAATIGLLLERAGGRETGPFRAGYLNPHSINLCRRDARLAEELRGFDLLYPDGIGLVWAARWLGHPLAERVTASDFLPDLCRGAAAAGRSLYFVGGAPGVAETAARRLGEEAPGLEIRGVDHGFFDDPGAGEVVARVRDARPDLCLVGLGSPRQERWVLHHAPALGVPVVWSVGGVFDFYSGRRRRAPAWMQRLGVEWAHRMALEPRRLWRRYLLGNLAFLAATLRERSGTGSG